MTVGFSLPVKSFNFDTDSAKSKAWRKKHLVVYINSVYKNDDDNGLTY